MLVRAKKMDFVFKRLKMENKFKFSSNHTGKKSDQEEDQDVHANWFLQQNNISSKISMSKKKLILVIDRDLIKVFPLIPLP